MDCLLFVRQQFPFGPASPGDGSITTGTLGGSPDRYSATAFLSASPKADAAQTAAALILVLKTVLCHGEVWKPGARSFGTALVGPFHPGFAKKGLTLPPLEAPASESSEAPKERQDMCGCSTHNSGNAGTTAVPANGSLTLRVEDMTCGHCAGTIKQAVETALPGTQVEADLASKLLSIQGTADLSAVKAIVTGAGYTPSVAA
jgi:copper chaperone